MTVKKKIIIGTIAGLILIITFGLAKYYKAYVLYRIPTSTMGPTFPINQIIFGSSLLSVQKGDIVAYEADPLSYEPSQTTYEAVCRIIATESDTLQIINGLLFINNNFCDDTLNLSYNFKLATIEIAEKLSEYQKTYKLFPNLNDSVILNASYTEIKKLALKRIFKREIENSVTIIPKLFNIHTDKNWTLDNMGPIIIPADYYFLMGDNRSNSADSRLRGFVNKNKIIARISSEK